MVSDQMDFNDHAYRRFVEKIKVNHFVTPCSLTLHTNAPQDSLDPNGILSPGKMGIWPKKYRHLRDSCQKISNGTNGESATNGR